MKKLLLVEDEPNFARFVQLELEYEGFHITVCSDGREGYKQASEHKWDMIFLDIMLPGISGIEICRRLRSQHNKTPIIMLTARDSVLDRVAGLDSGADDYIAKPFAIEELLARMRAIFRRVEVDEAKGESHDDGITAIHDITVNILSRTVKKKGKRIELTKREFDLLITLLQHRNEVMNRDRLLNEVWGYDAEIETNVVDVYIRYLRQKLDPGQYFIQTIRGVGYMLKG
ncbi:response regulator transcription factor [Cohnella candidum]|uniref:DNA-binding response regulator n=1 Tax=Cohnella candidum TaxID=2674991 RepID=A0A3G3JW16_9BACL|nr:response regulator transcription factor [Cohnella candidum]AYQ72443.1 DNA-binding response regulator [Cohnella candidum]